MLAHTRAHPKRRDAAAICAPCKGAYEHIQPFSKRLILETNMNRCFVITKVDLRQLKLVSNKRGEKEDISKQGLKLKSLNVKVAETIGSK